MRPALFTTVLLALACLVGAPSRAAPAKEPVLAIVGVTVIPMTGAGVVLKDQTVVVRDGKIAAIGARGAVKIPAGARRIEGAGRYLIPGLNDVHVHLPVADVVAPKADAASLRIDDTMFLFLANGVTRVQVMAGSASALTLRDEVNSGRRLGPRMGVNTPMFDGARPVWPAPMGVTVTAATAREQVRAYKAAGYDRIKIYSGLPLDAFDATMAAAKEFGMPVDGHIPRAVSIEHLMESGVANVAHAEEFIGGANRTGQSAAYYTDLTKRSGVWVTPTLTTYHNILFQAQDLPAVLARDVNAYEHPGVLAGWMPDTNRYRTFGAPDQLKRLTDGWAFIQALTRELHAKGVPMLTGTDVLNPPIVPGFYLHDELREMVALGLTPYEALDASTSNPARFFGESASSGTVEVGKRADLVLLGADPLKDIGASRRIEGVVTAGRWLGRAEITAGLARIRAFYAANRKALETFGAAKP